MNKRDRMRSVLLHEEIDEILCSFWHHFPEDRWFSDSAVNAHLDYYKGCNLDFLKIMEEVRYDFSILDSKGFEGYIPPKRKTKERNAQIDIIKRISDEIDSECYIFTTIFDPLRTVGIIKGYEYVEAQIKENEKAVSSAFMVLAESIAEYATDCLNAGADGIYFSSKGAEIDRFSEDTFHNIVYNPDKLIAEGIFETSKNTILHICGYDTELTYYKDFPAAIVNFDCHNGRYDLNSGANIFSDRIILGGMDNRTGVLVNGAIEEIDAKVTEVLEHYTAPNPLILGADCTLPEDVSYDRIASAVKACHNHRK